MSSQPRKPCRCNELPPLAGLLAAPAVGGITAALLAAEGEHHSASELPHREIGEPHEAAALAEAPRASELDCLIALARAHPGLKITLSF